MEQQYAMDAEGPPVSGIDRHAMLAPGELAQFTARRPWRGLGIIGIDVLLMLAAIALCEAFWSPLAYALAVMFIGARQIGLATIVMHDGVHGLLLRDRRHNDRLARSACWVLLLPVIEDFHAFRRIHLQHHRNTNDAADPDLPVVRLLFGASRARLAVILLLYLAGVRFFTYYVPLYLRRASWPQRILACGAFGAILAGAWFSFYPCRLFLLYWLLPLATWGMFVNMVRFMVEHYPPGLYGRSSAAAGMILTRDVLPTWFDVLFVTTRSINYHFTHHLFPAVPFTRLKPLQRHLARSAAYRAVAHVTRGYHRAVLEVFTKELPVRPAAVVP